MEGAELGALMLSTCIVGTLLYSTDSPLNSLELSRGFRSVLMGTAIAVTTFLIIRSPFGRRSRAHFNPAVTLAFLWLRRVRRWDALCYVVAHFVGAVLGVAVAHEILGVHLSSAPVLYLVTTPGTYGKLTAFMAEFVLSGLLMGIVVYASNHRLLVPFSPILVALLTLFCILLFNLRIQRESGKNFFVRIVRVDMAGHLDLFRGALPGNADVRSNLHKARGIESDLLCKSIS
jgi:aquaporin Z